MTLCLEPTCQTTAGCQCGYREINCQWPDARDSTTKSAAWDGAMASYKKGLAAGRAQALREEGDALCDLFNAAGHYKNTHSEDDRAALEAAMERAATFLAKP